MGSNNAIEKKATNIVEASILRCPYFDPYIDSNDKTPSWDGNIFVYHTTNTEKENLAGKVPIQIKGTKKANLSKPKISFSAETSDLRNYLSDGGVIYFVVYIDENDNTHKIYYVNLLPYDLKIILKEAGTQKHKTIYLSEFPESDSQEIANIFMNFIDNRPKQMSYINKETPSLSDLEKQGIEIESVSFSVFGVGLKGSAVERFVTTHEFYLYAKPKGIDIEIPVEKMSNIQMFHEFHAPIAVRGKTYYPVYSKVFSQGEATIRIGKSFSIKIPSSGNRLVINHRLNGYLSERIRDTEFMLAALEAKEFTINTAIVPLNKVDDSFGHRLEAHFEHLKKVGLMLHQLGVKEDLNCDILSERDERIIRKLVDAVVYHKHVRLDGLTEIVHYCSVDIANLSFLIWAHRQKDGLYSIDSFFNLYPVVYSNATETNDPIPASQFLVMRKENFLHVSNIDYDRIYDSLVSSKPSELFFNHAILLLLEILKAYDAQENKDVGLLNLAEKLCHWLEKNDFLTEPAIILLNKLQIAKRKRPLALEELALLFCLKGQNPPNAILCGTNILLENYDEAQKCFEQLFEEEREEFIQYPICHFWCKGGNP